MCNRVSLGDNGNRARLPATALFHAAACKHLPLPGRYPAVAVTANMAGTMNVPSLAAESGVRRLVNVPTDKAANPASVPGMTKRLAEIVTVQLAAGARPASVRFGNVLASRGSFAETLTYQVSRGLPATITDPAMSRYFMTIPRAAGLVTEAAFPADGLSTFILETGQPRVIADGETPRPTPHPAITAVDAVTVPLDGIVALCGAASGVLTLTGGVLYIADARFSTIVAGQTRTRRCSAITRPFTSTSASPRAASTQP